MDKIIASMDVGLKRIGLAIAINGVTLPCPPVLRKNRNQAARDVKLFLDERNVKTLIVGLPKGGSSEEEMERRIKHFISLLNFNGEIFYIDESYSSVLANENKAFKDERDGKLDSLSAKIILERYLNL